MLQRLGRYEVLETLAGGGQGTVYLGREDGSEEVVAIKVMHPGHTGEALYLDALRREANLATRLEHPNVTQIQDFQFAYVKLPELTPKYSCYIRTDYFVVTHTINVW